MEIIFKKIMESNNGFKNCKKSVQANINSLNAVLFKKRIKNTEFTIISNNCWGAEVYRELKIKYLTPFVGLYMFAPCYLGLLRNLDRYMHKELIFIEKSRYDEAKSCKEKYPIGLLGDSEIHFVHYRNVAEAREKWARRAARINWKNIFIEFCDRDNFTTKLLDDFEKLDFPHKICFTSARYPMFKSTVWIKECVNKSSVMDGVQLYKACQKYIDIADWLNGGSGRLCFPLRIFSNFVYWINCPRIRQDNS